MRENGWRRRWLTLVPAGFSMVCAVVLAVQQMEIRELKEALQASPADAAAQTTSTAGSPAPNRSGVAEAPGVEAREIARLNELVEKLTGEISQLEQLRIENQGLRAKLESQAGNGLTQDEIDALEKARERAMRIHCINNLKQFGLAAHVWASDHNDIFPPDIVSMSNELNTPKILVCPADPGREAALSFSTFTPANCSYDYLAASASVRDAHTTTRVLSRCSIHGNYGVCDGSVQAVGTKNPEWLVHRDGKLYLEIPRNR
jgi:hypothetical protein